MICGGCDRHQDELDQARADAERAKAQVNSCRARLQQMQDDKARLIEKLADVTEQLQQADSKLATALPAQGRLQDQMGERTRQRDAAVQQVTAGKNTIQQLRQRLTAFEAEIREYEGWVKDLQATIAQLEAQVSAAGQGEDEGPAEESSGEEAADGNST
jgi:chromosome segregation ATPase